MATAPPQPQSQYPAGPGVQRKRRRHVIAATFYAVLAVLSLVAVFSGQPIGLLGALLFGAYSTYLFRGGRFVIFIF